MPANQSTPEVTMALEPCPFCHGPAVNVAGEYVTCGSPPFIECAGRSIKADADAWNTRTPARGGDELREAVARIIIGPRDDRHTGTQGDGRPTLRQLQDIRWEWSSDQERKEALWIANRILALLASTAMAGAGEVERSAIKEYLIACADEADRQGSLFAGRDASIVAACRSEAKAYRNAARMIFDQDHASYRTAAPPVEGLTSGEGVDRALAYAFVGKLKRSQKADAAKRIGIELNYDLSSLDRDKAFLRSVADQGKSADLRLIVSAMLPASDAEAIASPKATATASVREKARTLALAVCDWKSIKNPTQHDEQKLIDAADAVLATLTDSGTAASIGGERA